jgi:protein-tyrosine phosphatase
MERSMAIAGVAANRPLALDGAKNLRDLGGYPLRGGGRTARGAFLRSDATGELSPLDIEKLRSMGLSLVIDLRGPGEVGAAPSRLLGIEGVRYVNKPLFDGVQSSGFAGSLPDSMAGLYVSLLDGSRERLREVFEELAAAEGTRLFNCAAGKDRTGVVAMLLLELAGVEDEAIVADYASSASNMAALFERQSAALRVRGILLPPHILESRPEDMRAALGHLRGAYGTAEAYLLSSGLGSRAIDRLRGLLVGGRS